MGGDFDMNSYQLYLKANDLVKQCGSRDPMHIATSLGIKVYEEPAFKDLLGMYAYRWRTRMIFLNPRLDEYMKKMVLAHEIGHDQEHREQAKEKGLQEFTLFNMKDTTEYEANAFASHILLEDNDVYSLAKEGYDVVQIAMSLGSDINLMLIKMQEMNKLGYDFNLPCTPDSRFFKKIHV